MIFRRIPATLGVSALLVLPAASASAAAPASTATTATTALTAATAQAATTVQAVSAARVVASDPDADFLTSAYQTNLAEVAAGRIAWSKSTNPQVKRLAATFMVDHIRMNSDVYQTARRLRVVLPAGPTPEQQAQTRRYEAAGADTFDEYYITTQLAGHRAALRLVGEEAERGSDPAVKELAAKAAPIIARHQQMLREAATAEGLAGYVDAGGRQP